MKTTVSFAMSWLLWNVALVVLVVGIEHDWPRETLLWLGLAEVWLFGCVILSVAEMIVRALKR